MLSVVSWLPVQFSILKLFIAPVKFKVVMLLLLQYKISKFDKLAMLSDVNKLYEQSKDFRLTKPETLTAVSWLFLQDKFSSVVMPLTLMDVNWLSLQLKPRRLDNPIPFKFMVVNWLVEHSKA